MSRLDDVRALYELLEQLRLRCGGTRRLRDCDARMGWPRRGLYLFFEDGEERTTTGSGPRVVRVGTHALTSSSKTSLWNRLSQHRGNADGDGGSHRGSIFRLLVGDALSAREGQSSSTWGVGSGASHAAESSGLSPEAVREQERPLERAVSEYLGALPFLWLEVDGPTGPRDREILERNLIGLLSNSKGQSIDPQSEGWLGRHCSRHRVRESGLWNNNHVDESYTPTVLAAFSRAIRARPGGESTPEEGVRFCAPCATTALSQWRGWPLKNPIPILPRHISGTCPDCGSTDGLNPDWIVFQNIHGPGNSGLPDEFALRIEPPESDSYAFLRKFGLPYLEEVDDPLRWPGMRAR